ncbi:MAG TPA: hypothetical protein V6D22_08875 [Candidatus Obscuribacterales bacterium]
MCKTCIYIASQQILAVIQGFLLVGQQVAIQVDEKLMKTSLAKSNKTRQFHYDTVLPATLFHCSRTRATVRLAAARSASAGKNQMATSLVPAVVLAVHACKLNSRSVYVLWVQKELV